ncbi:thioredoxin family protein [Desulfobacterota bacterium M19]
MKLKITCFVLLVLLFTLSAGSGGAGVASSLEAANGSGGCGQDRPRLAGTHQVATGDLATVDYTARLADGKLIVSTSGAGGQAEVVVAGEPASFPMLGEAVIGMEDGGTKKITIPPRDGFGARDSSKVKTFPVRQEIPPTEQLTFDEVKSRLGSKPEIGKELRILPFFKSRIIKVNDKTVTIRHLAKDGTEIKTPIGKTTVSLVDGKIALELHPLIGVPFFRQGKRGVIVSADAGGFKVDFNHPLAGKTITLDLKVIKIRKKSQLTDIGYVTWQKNLKAARKIAKIRHKPIFLLLYADWCPWCKKLKEEVLTDLRVRLLRDDFVWVKINSDKEKRYKKEFRQSGFPLIVLLNEDGQPVSRIDGFKNAAALRQGLLRWLSVRKQG